MSPGQSNYRPEALVNTRNVVQWSPAPRCTPAGGSTNNRILHIALCIVVAADIMLWHSQSSTLSLLMLGWDKKTSRPRQSNCALICFCSVTKKLFSGGCCYSQLISAAATFVGQPSKEVLLQRRRRHKQIIRQSTVQCLGSNGSKTSRNILGRGQGSVWSRKETLCCISVWAPRERRLEVVTTFSTSLISTGVPLCPLILGYCFMPSFIYEGSPLSQLSTVYTAIAPLYTEQESLARSAVKWSVWVWIKYFNEWSSKKQAAVQYLTSM